MLQLDDTVTFSNFRETLSDTVDEIKIISLTDINEVLIQPGRDLLTLITCNPIGANYERYVVYCERSSGGTAITGLFKLRTAFFILYNKAKENQSSVFMEGWFSLSFIWEDINSLKSLLWIRRCRSSRLRR